jgi:hypothetical protein
LGKIFGRGKNGKPEKTKGDGGPDRGLSYDQAKSVAGGEEKIARVELASREDVRPEILYYLAEDQSPDVRREIARNPQTPRQADKMLAADIDDEVRCVLASKIGRLIPGLSDRKSKKL